MDDPLKLAVLVGAGVVAGFVNTFAGGGSMLTLPALMLLGLPADVANGSNRLAVVTQTLAGLRGFHRAGKLDIASILPIVAPTVAGAALGAWVAAELLPREWVKPVLLGTMIAMALVMLVAPRTLTPAQGERRRLRDRPSAIGGLFLAGLYGGFVQAGVGFVLLAVLGGILRYDLVRANALKLATVLVFGCVALAIFVRAGQVDWPAAGLLALATVVGAQLGVRFALRVKPQLLRYVVVAGVVASSVAAFFR